MCLDVVTVAISTDFLVLSVAGITDTVRTRLELGSDYSPDLVEVRIRLLSEPHLDDAIQLRRGIVIMSDPNRFVDWLFSFAVVGLSPQNKSKKS